MYRFLSRAWRAIASDEDTLPEYKAEGTPETLIKMMHQSILKVTEDIEKMSFNTAISQLMIFNNELMKSEARYREPCEVFVKLLHPFAPHLAEELWEKLGHSGSLTHETWPEANAALAVENTVEVVFQVNGKVRARVEVAKETSKESLEAMAKANERVQEFLKGMTVLKVIVVPAKLVNFV
jgi:leucyl-tRNA synthetase